MNILPFSKYYAVHSSINKHINAYTLHVDDNARERLMEIFTEEDNHQQILRVAVKGGGCGDFNVLFSLVESEDVTADEVLIESNDIKLALGRHTLHVVHDSTITFEKRLSGSMFILHNPKAKSQCGCGTSFAF